MNYRTRTILIVNDDESKRDALSDMLCCDYNVLKTENGKNALKILKKESVFISAVIFGVNTIDGDVFDFLDEMEKLGAISRIPVIVTTKSNNHEIEVKCLKAGAIDFIKEPYDEYLVKIRLRNSITLRESLIAFYADGDSFSAMYQWSSFIKNVELTLKNNPDTKYDLIVTRVFEYQHLINKYGEQAAKDLLNFIGRMAFELTDGKATVCRFDAVSFALLIERVEGLTTSKEKLEMLRNRLESEAPIIDAKVRSSLIENVDSKSNPNLLCHQAFRMLDKLKETYGFAYNIFSQELKNEIAAKSMIEDSMRDALERKEFKVYYQPKFDISGEKNFIAGAEALVRWEHPTKGLIGPGAFIPLFENNGFITMLDKYMLETVCDDIREWIDNGGPNVPVSINISRVDFGHPRLAEEILDIVDSRNVPHELIHFEITESAFSNKDNLVIDDIHILHENGFVIELDDFGSGYSTLVSLQGLDLDIIKMDLSLIKKPLHGDKNVLDFAYKLMKLMNMKTVQEGVETKQQLEDVRSRGCDYVQGYYFSKPLSKEEFMNFFKTNYYKI